MTELTKPNQVRSYHRGNFTLLTSLPEATREPPSKVFTGWNDPGDNYTAELRLAHVTWTAAPHPGFWWSCLRRAEPKRWGHPAGRSRQQLSRQSLWDTERPPGPFQAWGSPCNKSKDTPKQVYKSGVILSVYVSSTDSFNTYTYKYKWGDVCNMRQIMYINMSCARQWRGQGRPAGPGADDQWVGAAQGWAMILAVAPPG